VKKNLIFLIGKAPTYITIKGTHMSIRFDSGIWVLTEVNPRSYKTELVDVYTDEAAALEALVQAFVDKPNKWFMLDNTNRRWIYSTVE
jgi:hypothetical protein